MKYSVHLKIDGVINPDILHGETLPPLIQEARERYRMGLSTPILVTERGRADIWTVADGYNKFKKLRKYKGVK